VSTFSGQAPVAAAILVISAVGCKGKPQEKIHGSLAKRLSAKLRTTGEIDLRGVAEGNWDRLGLFWRATPEDVAAKLGFAWDHPDISKASSSGDTVLFLVVNDKAVVDHVVIPEAEFISCLGSIVVPRGDAVFTVAEGVVCPTSQVRKELMQGPR
jgi:hypothetical protein